MHAKVSYIRFAGSYSIHQTYDVKRTGIVFKRRERGGGACIIIVCQFAYFYEFKTQNSLYQNYKWHENSKGSYTGNYHESL